MRINRAHLHVQCVKFSAWLGELPSSTVAPLSCHRLLSRRRASRHMSCTRLYEYMRASSMCIGCIHGTWKLFSRSQGRISCYPSKLDKKSLDQMLSKRPLSCHSLLSLMLHWLSCPCYVKKLRYCCLDIFCLSDLFQTPSQICCWLEDMLLAPFVLPSIVFVNCGFFQELSFCCLWLSFAH